MSEFYMIGLFARKINKIPEFYIIVAPKCPNSQDNCPKMYFPELGRGGSTCPVPPLAPRLLRLWPTDCTVSRRRFIDGHRTTRLTRPPWRERSVCVLTGYWTAWSATTAACSSHTPSVTSRRPRTD